MPAILELPEVRQRVSPISVEDYHRLSEFNQRGRRTELIRGIVIEKMSKSPLHRLIASLLYDRVSAQLPPGFSVWKEEPLMLLDSEPEPDLSVTKGGRRDFLRSHPTSAELVVEVAVTSPALDRENATLYAEAGVQEYWIVLAGERQVEVYREPKNGRYTEKSLHGPEGLLACVAIPQIQVRVSELFG
jgi:Uma2 family endonuclease